MAASTPDPDPGQDDAAAFLLLEQLRWGGAPVSCPHCGVAGRCYYLAPADGVTRRTRTGAPTARRVWKCGSCRRQFSVLTGTVLEGTRMALSSWVRLVEELVGERVGDRSPDTGLAGAGRPATARVRAVSGLGAEGARHMLARWDAAVACEPLRSELARSRQ